MMSRSIRATASTLAVLALAGCASLSESPLTSWIPTIPVPSFGWLFGKSNKPGPLPEVKGNATAQVAWQAGIGKAHPGFAPAVTPVGIFAAASDGALARLDTVSGRVVWRINAGRNVSAGPGADDKLVVVGTDKGDILVFDADGKERWTAHVSSEVIAPPRVVGNTVVAFAGDGRIYGLAVADGKTRWVHERVNPPLTVRNTAGGVVSAGALFIGTAGGHLIALDPETGTVGWDATVSTPKGATELERIADVTSLPRVDEHDACAVAYQGRLACFDVVRGTLRWSRDISSLAGIAVGAKNIYITDDRGAVQALDRSNGASVWKQDALSQRRIGGPQLVGDYVGVVDVEGYLHLLSRDDGKYVGRMATDGSQPTSQPEQLAGSLLWQSEAGNVYLVSAK